MYLAQKILELNLTNEEDHDVDYKPEITLQWLLDSSISTKHIHKTCSYFSTTMNVIEPILHDLLRFDKWNQNLPDSIRNKLTKSINFKEIINNTKLIEYIKTIHIEIRNKKIKDELLSNIEPLEYIYEYILLYKDSLNKNNVDYDKKIQEKKELRRKRILEIIDSLQLIDKKIKCWHLTNRPSLMQKAESGDDSLREVILIPFVLQSRIKYIIWLLKTKEEKNNFSQIRDKKETKDMRILSSNLSILNYSLSEFWNCLQMLLHHSNTMLYSKNISNLFDQLYTCAGKFTSLTFTESSVLDDLVFFTSEEQTYNKRIEITKGKYKTVKETKTIYFVNEDFLQKSEMIFSGFQMMFEYHDYLIQETKSFKKKSINSSTAKNIAHWLTKDNISNRSLLEPIQMNLGVQMYRTRLIISEYEIFKLKTKMKSEASALGTFRRQVQDQTIRLLQDEILTKDDNSKHQLALPIRMIQHLYKLHNEKDTDKNQILEHNQYLKDELGCTEKECIIGSLLVLANNMDAKLSSKNTEKNFRSEYIVLREDWKYPPENLIRKGIPIFIEIFNEIVILYKNEIFYFNDFFSSCMEWAILIGRDPHLKGKLFTDEEIDIVDFLQLQTDDMEIEDLKELIESSTIDKKEDIQSLPDYYLHDDDDSNPVDSFEW